MIELILLAATVVLSVGILFAIVAFLAHKQNQRVLAARADKALQAMLQTGEFLEGLAEHPSLPVEVRQRAEALSRHYPKGDQLRVFAETLLTQIRRGVVRFTA